jgi:hypothetical protein
MAIADVQENVREHRGQSAFNGNSCRARNHQDDRFSAVACVVESGGIQFLSDNLLPKNVL